MRCRADSLTVGTARALGATVVAGSYPVLVVDRQGVQLWDSETATTQLLSLPWSQLGSAVLGDPHGDPTAMVTHGVYRLEHAYDRLLIPAESGDGATGLQLPVLAGNPIARGTSFADAYDLRTLSRKINGYKAVHDREHSASAGDSVDTPR